MHIPDGYLSPSTCAALYAAAVPFWYLALQRVKKAMHSRTVPLLSMFAAFSFVIMMFNLPLPGGTTGHAVGMGIAAIVLGPAVSMLAISMALLIQALFFGDGGVTAFGANCFNMAIIGSLVAYAVYRVIAWRAGLTSMRRVVAAGLAGYAAINAAAFCAAIEFGIQPMFFHDASGAPLYAPYPLHIAIPAMMIGHLTLAGLAEFIVSAGLVSYLQRTDTAMLHHTAPDARPHAGAPLRNAWGVRGLWAGLTVLLVLTPLGIWATGSAWGEWSAAELADSKARHKIAEVSDNVAPPGHAPDGLRRLASAWQAPMAGYAPRFVNNRSLAYLVSAAAGVTLIMAALWLMKIMLVRRRRRSGFVERTIGSLLAALREAIVAEDLALSKGFLQALDPRVKLVGIGALICAAVATQRMPVLLGLFCLSVAFAIASRVPLRLLAARVWIPVLAFTGLIALPALFLTPGAIVFRVMTMQGLTAAAFLVMRAETTATLALSLIFCTVWSRLLRALRFFRIPTVAVVMVSMTYRYIFVFLETAQSMFESRQTRLVGRLEPAEQRRFAAASVGVLLDKTVQLSGDVELAMQARGFRGEVKLLDDLRMNHSDWLHLSAFLATAAIAVWLGR